MSLGACFEISKAHTIHSQPFFSLVPCGTDISYEVLLQCLAYLSASLRPDMMVINSPSETGSPI